MSGEKSGEQSSVVRRWGIRIGVLLLVMASALVCSAQADPRSLRPTISARYPSVRWIGTARLAAWMGHRSERGQDRRPVHLLDAREPAEFRVSHLRGAERIDPDHPDLSALSFPRGDRVVVYCSVGYRSGAIAARLMEAGYREVYNLEGGIFAWANEGRPLFRGQARASRVHPYDAVWGRMLHADRRAPLD